MKRLAIAAAGCVLLFATGAAAAPSQKQIDLAERYIKSTHMADNIAASMRTMRPMLMQEAEARLPVDQRKVLGEAFDAAYQHFIDAYFSRIAPILADVYSEEELTQIVAFYESPVGQAMVAKSPVLSEKLAPLAIELMPEMQADLTAELCARVACASDSATAKIHS